MGILRNMGRILTTGLALALVACSGQAPPVDSPTPAPTGDTTPAIVATATTAPTLAPTLAPDPSPTPTIPVAPRPTLAPTPAATVMPPESVPVIPRRVLFGNPDKAAARLSSDGKWLSYLAPVDGVLNVWVAPAGSPDEAKPVTEDKIRGVRGYFWAFTNQHIIYVQDKQGDENWRVYSVDLNTNETRDLTPLENVQARVQTVSPQFPDEIIIGLNDRNPQLHDLYRVSIRSGDRELIQQNPGFSSFLTDDDFNVRFAFQVTSDGGAEILAATDDAGWEPFLKIDMEDVLTTGPIGFDQTGRVMYMLDSRGRNTAALTTLDLDTGAEEVVAENPRADLSRAMVHPTEKQVQAVGFTYQRTEWQILDESIASDLEVLGTVADGDLEVTSRTLDDRQWIAAYNLDNGPVQYYLYDRESQEARFLFTNRQALEDLALARMHSVVIEARDGLDLISYYMLPAESDVDGDAHPDEPLPMVLVVHGGPWFRDSWGYDSLHQMLANRGYAVLSVNFRGSTGFGKEFINASNLEWGGRMHDDLIDAVQWAIGEGIADPGRVAIMGGSYGGYATLIGLTFTPRVFACGVDIVGPSNLLTFMEAIPAYWQPQVELFATRIGDHRTEEGRTFLAQRSPLSRVDQITRPLLIGQGANDPRVKQAESDQIVEAMQEKDIPVTYVLYPDEGHGFARPENNLSFFAVTDAFLAQCLRGRHEPIGNDFEGSSLSVQAGAEHVPGLEAAIR